MDKVSLEDILNDDPFNLLGEIKAKNPVITQDDRLIASFEEINDFYEKNGTKPQKSTDMNERRLCSRLEGIINDPSKVVVLKKYDRFNLIRRIFLAKIIEF
jgi:hypothetical protein